VTSLICPIRNLRTCTGITALTWCPTTISKSVYRFVAPQKVSASTLLIDSCVVAERHTYHREKAEKVRSLPSKVFSALTISISLNQPKDADAEIFFSSESDGSGCFVARDASGWEHWCFVFQGAEAGGGYKSTHFVLHTACLTILEHALKDTHPLSTVQTLDDFYEVLCTRSNDWDGVGVDDFYEVLCARSNDWVGVGVPLKHRHYGAQQFWEQEWKAKKGWEVRTSVSGEDSSCFNNNSTTKSKSSSSSPTLSRSPE
jgi:hypothetical protein